MPGKSSMLEDGIYSTSLNNDTCEVNSSKQQHIYKGFLCDININKPVTVLRDTGSSVHAIHEKFVSPDQYINKSQCIVTFSGRREHFDLARINVDTPFLKGVVTACVLRDYPEKLRYFDLLVGNGGVLDSPIALDPSSENVDLWYESHFPRISEKTLLPCSQAVTSADSSKKKPYSKETSGYRNSNSEQTKLKSSKSTSRSYERRISLVQVLNYAYATIMFVTVLFGIFPKIFSNNFMPSWKQMRSTIVNRLSLSRQSHMSYRYNIYDRDVIKI